MLKHLLTLTATLASVTIAKPAFAEVTLQAFYMNAESVASHQNLNLILIDGFKRMNRLLLQFQIGTVDLLFPTLMQTLMEMG